MEGIMETAKLFINGHSQAVRLPKECRFNGKDVYVKKIDGIVMLIPKEGSWEVFALSLDKFSDDYFADGRDQNGMRVAAGVYFLRLESGGESVTKRLTLVGRH